VISLFSGQGQSKRSSHEWTGTGLPEVTRVERQGQQVVVTGTGDLVNAVILALHTVGVTARDVQLDASNLEDAFVKLTENGSRLDQEGAMP
jgi:ABC-2 type transport system ATP-binding protein